MVDQIDDFFDLDEIMKPVRRPRNLTLPFLQNRLYRVLKWATDSSDPDSGNTGVKDLEATASLDDANIVSSERVMHAVGTNGDPEVRLHTPVLDIDVPALLIPSTTPGKNHLFFDVEMTWRQYAMLLDVMAEVGILEEGYVKASKARGFTAVRLPWVRKG